MESNIRKIIDEMCPIKKLKVRELQEPWLTHYLIESIYERKNLQRRAKRSHNQEDWVRAKRARNDLKQAFKRAKADFVWDNSDRYNKDPKTFWDQINQVIPQNNSNSLINWEEKKPPIRLSTVKPQQIISTIFLLTLAPNLSKNIILRGILIFCL